MTYLVILGIGGGLGAEQLSRLDDASVVSRWAYSAASGSRFSDALYYDLKVDAATVDAAREFALAVVGANDVWVRNVVKLA